MVDNQSHPLQRQTITIEAPKPSDNLRCTNLGGWGATCQGELPTGGQWDKFEKNLHINVQELLAAEIALRCYLKDKQNLSVYLVIDNTTALSRYGHFSSQKGFH